MENDRIETVSFLVYESSQTRSDRIIHRLIIALLLSVIMLFVSNALWLYAWSQYEYISDEVSLNNRNGITTFVGNDGVITNGDNN